MYYALLHSLRLKYLPVFLFSSVSRRHDKQILDSFLHIRYVQVWDIVFTLAGLFWVPVYGILKPRVQRDVQWFSNMSFLSSTYYKQKGNTQYLIYQVTDSSWFLSYARYGPEFKTMDYIEVEALNYTIDIFSSDKCYFVSILFSLSSSIYKDQIRGDWVGWHIIATNLP